MNPCFGRLKTCLDALRSASMSPSCAVWNGPKPGEIQSDTKTNGTFLILLVGLLAHYCFSCMIQTYANLRK